MRFTYGFVCDAKNARCTKHTCSPRCRCLLASLQQVVMTSSAAKRQHTDGTYKYKTVDTIRLPIFSEDICPSFSKSCIAYETSVLYISIRAAISFCSDDSKNFVMSAALVTAPSLCLSEASFGECRPWARGAHRKSPRVTKNDMAALAGKISTVQFPICCVDSPQFSFPSSGTNLNMIAPATKRMMILATP